MKFSNETSGFSVIKKELAFGTFLQFIDLFHINKGIIGSIIINPSGCVTSNKSILGTFRQEPINLRTVAENSV